MDFTFCRTLSLLLLIFTFLVPFTCSLSTFSIANTSNHTVVCALVRPLNSQRSSLNCSSFPTGIQIPVNLNFEFAGVVAGDGFMCGLISFPSSSINSTMICWRFSTNDTGMKPRRIYRGPDIRELKAGNWRICGLVNVSNDLECWQSRKFSTAAAPNFSNIAVSDEFICGLLPNGTVKCLGNVNNITAQAPTGTYSLIAAGSRYACVLTDDNDMECWGHTLVEKPQGKFLSMAPGENRICALRVNETVTCWGQNNFILPPSLEGEYFSSIEAKRDIFCGVLKSNFSLYCWGNDNFNSNFKVFDRVVPGPCSTTSSCRCGPMTGTGSFCPQGQSICEHCKIGNCTFPPVDEPPKQQPSWPPSLPPQGDSKSCEWNGKMIAFLVVGCVGSLALLLFSAFFVFKYCKCRGCRVHDSGRLDETETTLELEQGPNPPENPQPEQASPVLEKRLSQLASMGNAGQLEEFPLELLLEATNNFSEDHKTGTGSFGSVYRGVLGDGREVAIKRAEASCSSSYAIGTRRQEDKDTAFVHELESLSRLHHKHLVRLLGFCESSNERILVYEYMHNGTLHDHLHKLQSSPLMTWPARIKLALDAARGIEYLHEYAVPPIIHRDIKSSNILLDSTWTAKVSDFGLSLMGPPDDESHLSLKAAGTVGYMDPEYYRLQQLTTKSDVYSFGVVLLELLSGYKAIHRNENGVPRNVVDFVVPYIVQDEIHRVLDRRVPPPTPFEIEAVAYIGYLAADCVTLEGRDRPPMTEVVNSLERALAACLVDPTSLSRSNTESST
ncbi:hypothetical protein K2173_007107 [Erythroxylum novogranatense]|uniref:non-specific serine/threonine protein kinase n=1 Tax=Erythroxylum novogranatense TaxID=1862640 RepID=A0AAV8T006_9ROSI|nr:hypothetical protein K2173_007107 [Erythroxylum novogranatense]